MSIILSKLKKNYSHVGILSAMPEEVGIILEHLNSIQKFKYGDFEIYSGEMVINDTKKVFISTAWSGWGKVSAARATTRLLSTTFNNIPVEIALFTGVAGGIDSTLRQWDIVISESLIQHDMDARPLFDKYVVPALNVEKVFANKTILEKVYNSINKALTQKKLSKFGKLHKGLIATGDMFISNREKINQLSEEIFGLLAVEMEGAAFAQVAEQEKIDWIVMRVISDQANENAPNEFSEFLSIYKLKSFQLIKCFLDSIIV